jgi:hypothetical protein
MRFHFLALIALASLPALGQEFRGGISGIVVDAQGAVVPGVGIEAQNLATNDVSRTVTNSTGYYAFPVIAIGTYRITATASGFKTAVRDQLEVRVGDQVRQDLKLELGAVVESVTVSAGAELLQELVSDKGQVVGEENVRDMPSVGRNPFLLGIEAPGVQFDIGANVLSMAVRPFDSGNNVAESLSINGGRTGASDLLLDGVPNTTVETGGVATNMAFVPNQDAVSEFRIASSIYDAQYGRSAGGTMSVSIKNGGNKYHGAAYWYVKNTILTANSFDQNRLGVPRAAYHQQEPGFELDGPLVIPHVYDGHNKTFFMYSYELWRDEIPSPITSTTPQALALQGDFSTTLQSNNKPITIYDPATAAATSPYARTPFPGDIVPASRFNPAGVKLASYIPLPNVGDQSTYAGQTNNLVIAPNSRTDAYDAHVARIDQQINAKERFFSRFIRGYRTEVRGLGGFSKGASPYFTDGRMSQGGNADLTSILSPSTVLTSRIGYLRHDLWITLYTSGFDPTTLGFPSSLLSSLPAFFPTITPSGYTTYGSGRSGGNTFTEAATWSWSEIVNKTAGRHQVKFGGEFRTMLNNLVSATTNFGSYSFSALWTQQYPLSSSSAAGNAIASMLLGMPTSGSAPINPAFAYGLHYYGGFVQDDWRATSKLTFSLGVRWDYESPVTERNNQESARFDGSATSPLQVVDPYQPGATLKGGLLFPTGDNRLPYGRDLNNFQPRVGVAWRPINDTVVRAGYAMSYLATFTAPPAQGFATATPYVASNNSNISFAGNYLNNPYPQGILTPSGSSLGLSTFLGQSVSFVDPNRVVPKVAQYSLGVQRKLPWRTVVEASYVGSHSMQLDVSHQLNAVSMAQLLQYGGSKVGSNPNLTDTVPNPFAGLLPSTNLNGGTTSLQQLLLPYPQFTGVTETNLPIGRSWYNSLQVRVDKRFSHGLNVLLSYTRSKTLESVTYMNNQDPGPSRSLTSTDTPNRIVISGNWELPVFTHTHGIAGVFLHGWQANGIFVRQNGFPLAAPSGYYSTGIDPSLPDPIEQQYFNTCTRLTNGTLDNCTNLKTGQTLPVAFIQQQANTVRTLGLRFPTIRPPKVPNADVSLFKSFPVREGVRLQFRAEAFNLTNSPQFNVPSTSLSSSTAGVVTLTQVNDPRNMQMSLRLMF